MKVKTIKKLISITTVAAPIVTTLISCISIYKKGKDFEAQLKQQYDLSSKQLDAERQRIFDSISPETLKMIDESMSNLDKATPIDITEFKE